LVFFAPCKIIHIFIRNECRKIIQRKIEIKRIIKRLAHTTSTYSDRCLKIEVKLGEERIKCLGGIFVLGLGRNLLYTTDGAVWDARRLGRGQRQDMRPSTVIVRRNHAKWSIKQTLRRCVLSVRQPCMSKSRPAAASPWLSRGGNKSAVIS